MPLTEKGHEILSNMKEQYGEKKGEQVFYASKNAGTISGVDASSMPTVDGNAPGEAVRVLPQTVSAATINEANKRYWQQACDYPQTIKSDPPPR